MAKQVRSVEFLPEIFQTPINDQFLSATLDQLVQNPQFTQTQGFIGRRIGPGVNANDKYVIEPTKVRSDYQLEPGVVEIDPTDSRKIVDVITYPGINDALQLQGAVTNNANRLYTSDYYTWDPFVDFDKFINYAQYYWLPGGPLSVTVSSGTIPLSENFTVTRTNGAYRFSGVDGDNPTITLGRTGLYNFIIAQNVTETITYRVTNNDASSWNINYNSNPTLTLIRGNTYEFNLSQTSPWNFFIKTQPSLGTTNVYSAGVTNNGANEGLITFTVPQDAPDFLFYCNDLEFNLQGQFYIVDATPGQGPEFWIQAEPGVDGRMPRTPNISSRAVDGVTNNGIDLGTVAFAVPLATAQDQYYELPSIGQIDLATTLQFDQINDQYVDDFFATYPTGIDGITSLQGMTLVFLTEDSSPTPADLYTVWRIQYLSDVGGVYLSLQFVENINLNNQFSIGFGAEYANTSWFKDTTGYFSQIPLLTADKDVLYYQDSEDPAIFGVIKLIPELDVSTIIGAKTYTSPNGVTFSNGMKVTFTGDVVPTSYQNNEYYVEGVGTAIRLLPVVDFVTPETYTLDSTVPYDSTLYDTFNYDGGLNQPKVPDYLTINRASPDLNAWTRSNRWFHIDVINASCAYNNVVPVVNNDFRARRPILEFQAGTRLFDFGTQGLASVDIIDFTQTDALSSVNGSIGFSTDDYTLTNGSTIIFAADLDATVRRTVYSVEFVEPDSVDPLIAQPLIVLTPVTTALVDQTTVVLN